MRYIEQNPLRAGIVRQVWKYPWSSAAAHVENKDGCELLDMTHWKRISAQVNWRQILEKAQPKDQIESIRLNTHTGRPLAGNSFISKLEKALNRRLRPLPVGRPRKKTEE